MGVTYYGSKISDNITETPEGYLICHNVPISRVGEYRYIASEVGLDDELPPNAEVIVKRTPEEVFSKASMASFEGKPVVDDHPMEDVNTDNAAMYLKGVAQNIRAGDGDLVDCVIADLIVYDPVLKSEIKNGKREISCGYDSLWFKLADAVYEQRKIRGNHVAVVANGRAGHNICIRDSAAPSPSPKNKNNGGTKMSILHKMLGIFAKDASPEELVEAANAVAASEKKEPEKKETKDEGAPVTMEQVMAMLAELGKKVDGIVAAEKKEPEHKDDEIAALDALEEEIKSGKVSDEEDPGTQEKEKEVDPQLITDEEEKTGCGLSKETKDSLLASIAAVKPLIAGIADKVERKKVADSMAKLIRGNVVRSVDSQYSDIAKAANKSAAAKSKQSKDSEDPSLLGKNIRDRYNPHYQTKGGKQ